MLKTRTLTAILALWAASAPLTNAAAQIITDTAPAPTALTNRFFRDSKRGWFWYERDLEEPMKPDAPAPEPARAPEAPPAPAGAAPFSAAWIRDNLPKYLDKALDEPSFENVEAFFTVQRVAMDKASAFTDEAKLVTTGHPLLEELQRRPTGTYAANLMNNVANRHQEALLKQISQRAGIWWFYRSDCPYCDRMAPILANLERRYGFHILSVSLDGKPLPNGLFPNFRPNTGQAQKLGVTQTPSVFLVTPDGEITPLATGAVAQLELEERILIGATKGGIITEAQRNEARPVNVDGTADLSKFAATLAAVSAASGDLTVAPDAADPVAALRKLVKEGVR